MQRKSALSRLLIAGWHGNQGALTDVYQASRVSWDIAVREFRLGKANKVNGVSCQCEQCK